METFLFKTEKIESNYIKKYIYYIKFENKHMSAH